MACGEYHNLVALVCAFEAFNRIRSDVDACFHCFTIGECDRNLLIVRASLNIIDTVHKRLIQIKDDSFLDVGCPVGWKLHWASLNVILVDRRECFDILKRLQGLNQVVPVKFRWLEIFNSSEGTWLGSLVILVFFLLCLNFQFNFIPSCTLFRLRDRVCKFVNLGDKSIQSTGRGLGCWGVFGMGWCTLGIVFTLLAIGVVLEVSPGWFFSQPLLLFFKMLLLRSLLLGCLAIRIYLRETVLHVVAHLVLINAKH